MKKLVCLAITALLSVAGVLAQDSVKVHSSLTEYFTEISKLPVDTICARVDSVVCALAPRGKAAQSAAAGLAFDFFNSSKVMGVEGVSVHVADNYFLNGRLEWPDKNSFDRLATFADFNRSSLLGCDAEALSLQSMDSSIVSVRDVQADFKIIYFYEPGCPTCARQTKDLMLFCSMYIGAPVAVFAVNTGSDREAWEKYVTDNFEGELGKQVSLYHMWDPEAASGYHMKFGVMTTPMMLVLDGQNVIIGRKMDVRSVQYLLGVKNSEIVDYKELFDKIFASLDPVAYDDLLNVASSLSERTYGDVALFREVFSNLFDYLRSSSDYTMQTGALEIARRYIVGEPWQWSQEYVDRVVTMLGKEEKNPIDTKAPDLLLNDTKGRFQRLLKGNHNYTLVVFHLVSCKECEDLITQLAAMKKEFRRNSVKVKMVYTGRDEELWKNFVKVSPGDWTYLWDRDGGSGMMKKYDLEFVPHSYLLDHDGYIVAKDLNVKNLKKIIEIL